MRVETVKARVRDNPVLSRALAGPLWVLGKVRAPSRMPAVDLPGHWTPPPGPPAGTVPQGAGADPGVGAAGAPGIETPGPSGAVASGPA